MAGRIFVGAALLLLVAAVLMAADETPWFDMKNCQMCKPFMEPVDLMSDITWEQHKIAGGVMSVSLVKPEMVGAFREANAKCDALGEKLLAGEQMPLCGSCVAMGKLLEKGAVMEQVELKNGGVMLMTSSDPAVVADLHAYVDRNNAEMAKMMPPEPEEEE